MRRARRFEDPKARGGTSRPFRVTQDFVVHPRRFSSWPAATERPLAEVEVEDPADPLGLRLVHHQPPPLGWRS